jgi:cytochrome c peroxidase
MQHQSGHRPDQLRSQRSDDRYCVDLSPAAAVNPFWAFSLPSCGTVASLPLRNRTCHDTPDVGNHSVKLPVNIGIANGGANNNNPGLDIADLPVFALSCASGANAVKTYTVTDPGRALISGKCADIGKVKGPILRGLAGRAPYFHNGSAATLLDVVNFYNLRFNIGLTAAQMSDLAAFLQTL